MSETVSWISRLAERLRDWPRRTVSVRADEQRAGVLIPLIGAETSPSLVIERRAANLPNHPGQYGFPGGTVDDEDASIEATALREAREETALAPESIQVLGRLSDLRTPTGYVITPVVGAIRGPVVLTPSPDEVAFLIRVPVGFLLRDDAFRMVARRSGGLLIRTNALVFKEHVVWGATARILLELRRLIRSV